MDKSGTTSFNSVNEEAAYKMDYCFFSTILSAIMRLLLLIAIAINCSFYIKQRPKPND